MAFKDTAYYDLLDRLKSIKNSQDICLQKTEEYLCAEKSVTKSKTSGTQRNLVEVSKFFSSDDLETNNFPSPILEAPSEDSANKGHSNIEPSPTTFSGYPADTATSCETERFPSVCLKGSRPLGKGTSGSEVEPQSFESLEAPSRSKFKYLKKGQGTSRFRTNKKLKGFTNKQEKDRRPDFKNALLPSNQIAHTPTLSSDVKLNKFEVLERLVAQDSFCSTSSKVIGLLDESTPCSTPLSSKYGAATVEFTSTSEGKFQKQVSSATISFSPARKLFPYNERHCSKDQLPLLRSEERGQSGLQEGHFTPSVGSGNSGILKKGHPSSNSLLRVKFLERGVNVLEYDDSANDANNSAVFSDDSDLISLADLENLALLNFNVNVVHENSFTEGYSSSNYIKPVHKESETLALKKDHKKMAQSCSIVSNSNKTTISSCNNNSGSHLLKENRPLAQGNRSGRRSVQNKSDNFEEDLDVKSHKFLLLAMAENLKKEINLFKDKNSQVQQLVDELQKEKLAKEKERENSASTCKKNNSQLKQSRKRVKEKQDSSSISDSLLSKKVHDLNELLLKLQIENSNLKRKVCVLQKKGNVNDCPNKNINSSEVPILTTSLRRTSHSNGTVVNPSHSEPNEDKVISTYPSIPINTNPCSSNLNTNEPHSAQSIPKYKFLKGSGCAKTLKPMKHSIQLNQLSSVSSKNAKENPFPSTERQRDVAANKSDPCVSPYESTCSPPIASKGEVTPVPKLPESECHVNDRVNQNENMEALRADTPSAKNVISSTGSSVCMSGPEEKALDSQSCQHPNGDTKTVSSEKIVYYYSANNTTHTIYKEEGKEEFEFSNGQKEIYFKDGSYQILFPNNCSKSVYSNGSEVCVWEDGTVIKTSGEIRTTHFPNGQKEIYEKGDVRRIYPDGTVKILYADGTQETHYKNGKIRVKNANGEVFHTVPKPS